MAYKVDILTVQPRIAATMKMSIPDYSITMEKRVVRAMEKELNSRGIYLVEPTYNFSVAYDTSDLLEVIDVEIVVCVNQMGEDIGFIQFTELSEDQMVIRVEADTFEDIHIGLAEWMHNHDYVADGILRRVIHEGRHFIYDCPVKKSED